jgi:hypothetical protein
MKTIATLSTIAAFIAFVVVQFSFVNSIAVLFAAGLLTLTFADYRRTFRPLALRATGGTVARGSRERLGLAA